MTMSMAVIKLHVCCFTVHEVTCTDYNGQGVELGSIPMSSV